MKFARHLTSARIRVARIAAGVFCGLAIAVSVQTAAGAQSYVPGQLADQTAGQQATTTTTTTTTTTILKNAQVKGVTLQAVEPSFTGANTVPVASLGALALGFGVVLRVAARKRRVR